MGGEVGILRLEGRRLGRYRVVRQIGSGGMGVVYEGVDEGLGRRVAIKVLWPHLASDAEFVARFQREARAAARLRHPNVVQVYDVGVEGGVYYHVMEYVEGRPLSEVMRERGRFTVGEVVRLLGPVAGALDHAHRQGVVHRDVKPGNIMVGGGGRRGGRGGGAPPPAPRRGGAPRAGAPDNIWGGAGGEGGVDGPGLGEGGGRGEGDADGGGDGESGVHGAGAGEGGEGRGVDRRVQSGGGGVRDADGASAL